MPPLLTILIFLPLLGAIVLLVAPRAEWARPLALGASGLTLALGVVLAVRFDWRRGTFQLEEHVPWIPSLGASYHLAVDGLSLPLLLLTTVLVFLALLFSTHRRDSRAFFALFLAMEAGLIGVFSTLDLLLFYLFWELALVPLYFIIGVWGEEKRVEAALKFFLYTRVGSLAMLLSILALYLGTSPRTFDLPEIVRLARESEWPDAGAGLSASLILLGFVVGFGIKLPVIPFHSWLPDAHTEAPTAGSVVLAGLLLKLGGYGFLRLALPTVPAAFSAWAFPLAALAVISAIYGAAVAMAQQDLKRLIALSSVNHMGYVLLGVAVAAVSWADPADRLAAATGAAYQMVAHGLITGGLFFLVGMLAERTDIRLTSRLSGIWVALPLYGSFFALFAFAAFGLPALAGFAAEVQIILGTLGVSVWAASGMLVGILITTALFLWTLQRVLFGTPPAEWTRLAAPRLDELTILVVLTILIIVLGVAPGPLTSLISAALRQEILMPVPRG